MSYSPDGANAAFVVYSNNQYSSFIVDTVSGETILTLPAGKTSPLGWAPDSYRFAYAAKNEQTSKDEIVISDLAQTTDLHVTPSGIYSHSPVWSPRGNKIAYAGGNDDLMYCDTYLMNADGSGQVKLPRPTVSVNNWPGPFSPDGKYLLTKSKYYPPQGNGYYRLFRYDMDTGAYVKIVDVPENLIPFTTAWSPDGEKVLFPLSGNDIGIVSTDGSGSMTRIDLQGYITQAVWSPDGDWIIYMWKPKENSNRHYFDLYKIRADGSENTLLTTNQGADQYPFWH